MQKPTFSISAQADNVAEISILGTIGEDWWSETENTSRSVSEMLDSVKAISADKVIVKINSLGGDLFHALAIRDTLASFGDKLEIQLIGTNASAATVIAMAGKCRKMSKHGLFLVHKCSCFAMGNENALQRVIDEQRTYNETMCQIYRDATGISEQDLNDLMEANDGNGRWLTFSEAKAFGFVTEATDEAPALAMVASADLAAMKLPKLPEGFQAVEEQRIESAVRRIINKLFPNFQNQSKMTPVNNTPNIMALIGEISADEKGFVSLSSEQLNAIEARFAELADNATSAQESINSLTAEKEQATARIEELEEQCKHQTELLSKVPTADPKVLGDDATPTSNYAEQQKAIAFYKNLD